MLKNIHVYDSKGNEKGVASSDLKRLKLDDIVDVSVELKELSDDDSVIRYELKWTLNGDTKTFNFNGKILAKINAISSSGKRVLIEDFSHRSGYIVFAVWDFDKDKPSIVNIPVFFVISKQIQKLKIYFLGHMKVKYICESYLMNQSVFCYPRMLESHVLVLEL